MNKFKIRFDQIKMVQEIKIEKVNNFKIRFDLVKGGK